MNLAFFGFLVTGIVFAVYAYTFSSLAEKKLPAFLRQYAFAYYSLAAAFLVWAFASVHTGFLAHSVIVGNALLLLSGLFLVSVLFHKRRSSHRIALVVGVICAGVFMYLRLHQYAPAPYMMDGILIFNTQKVIAGLLGLLFVGVWLPANLKVAKEVTLPMPVAGMRFLYSFVYGISTVAAIFFIAFQTVSMVIASFVILSLCFVMMLYSNYVMSKLLPNKS